MSWDGGQHREARHPDCCKHQWQFHGILPLFADLRSIRRTPSAEGVRDFNWGHWWFEILTSLVGLFTGIYAILRGLDNTLVTELDASNADRLRPSW